MPPRLLSRTMHIAWDGDEELHPSKLVRRTATLTPDGRREDGPYRRECLTTIQTGAGSCHRYSPFAREPLSCVGRGRQPTCPQGARRLGSRSQGRDHAALAGALITLRSPGGGDQGGHVIARAPANSCGARGPPALNRSGNCAPTSLATGGPGRIPALRTSSPARSTGNGDRRARPCARRRLRRYAV